MKECISNSVVVMLSRVLCFRLWSCGTCQAYDNIVTQLPTNKLQAAYVAILIYLYQITKNTVCKLFGGDVDNKAKANN